MTRRALGALECLRDRAGGPLFLGHGFEGANVFGTPRYAFSLLCHVNSLLTNLLIAVLDLKIKAGEADKEIVRSR